MRYTLELSGHDDQGSPGITNLGGLFLSIDDAVDCAEDMTAKGRFHFGRPEHFRVRDEAGLVVQEGLS